MSASERGFVSAAVLVTTSRTVDTPQPRGQSPAGSRVPATAISASASLPALASRYAELPTVERSSQGQEAQRQPGFHSDTGTIAATEAAGPLSPHVGEGIGKKGAVEQAHPWPSTQAGPNARRRIPDVEKVQETPGDSEAAGPFAKAEAFTGLSNSDREPTKTCSQHQRPTADVHDSCLQDEAESRSAKSTSIEGVVARDADSFESVSQTAVTQTRSADDVTATPACQSQSGLRARDDAPSMTIRSHSRVSARRRHAGSTQSMRLSAIQWAPDTRRALAGPASLWSRSDDVEDNDIEDAHHCDIYEDLRGNDFFEDVYLEHGGEHEENDFDLEDIVVPREQHPEEQQSEQKDGELTRRPRGWDGQFDTVVEMHDSERTASSKDAEDGESSWIEPDTLASIGDEGSDLWATSPSIEVKDVQEVRTCDAAPRQVDPASSVPAKRISLEPLDRRFVDGTTGRDSFRELGASTSASTGGNHASASPGHRASDPSGPNALAPTKRDADDGTALADPVPTSGPSTALVLGSTAHKAAPRSNAEIDAATTVVAEGGPPVSQGPNSDSPGAPKDGHVRPTLVDLMIQLSASEDIDDDEARDEVGSLRQHSTSNLVALRRQPIHRQISLELFEEGDSDDTSSTASDSNESTPERDVVPTSPKAPKVNAKPPLQLTSEGISGMAQAAKATVRRNTQTSKYLKLFAPTNSAHDSYGVLATLHRQMNGAGWPKRGGWDSYLVRKSRAELDGGRVYGVKAKEGSVEVLVLSSNDVCGRIPPAIARLSSLKCLNLSDNHISGPIPTELGLLLQLQTLQLHGNNLRDEISPLLGSIINLVRLSLGHNKLTGCIPDSLGNLVNLKFLMVEHNRLTGHIPSFICRLPVLETFNAANNQLEGVIPAEIGGLKMLKKLDLSNNLLIGEIPASICALKFLSWLRLDSNDLEGSIPDKFGDLTNILILNLAFNNLSGPIPPALGTFPDIISAQLRGNAFEGPCPFPAGCATSKGSGLRTLDIGQNAIEEPFPDMSGLHELLTLTMNDNLFFGRLGDGLSRSCPKLFRLHLHNNSLDGEIPASLGTLTKLEDLDLSDNCFEGNLPSSLGSLTLLRKLAASNNELTGELPPLLGKLTRLTMLALDGNKFQGMIPRELGNLTSLERLYLERNELSGSIPSDLCGCVLLEEMYFHENKLWGSLPDSLRRLKALRYLLVHRNRLTGNVPEWLAELSQLRGLILGENLLRGVIPWQLGHLHKLQDLYLNDNKLEGIIPERLVANCDRLQRLYLGNNRLTGRVPRSLANVRDLRELDIENNNFHGELPMPLFLKASLGPDARGLKFGGNPRIVDSRAHFASTVAGIRRTKPRRVSITSSAGLRPVALMVSELVVNKARRGSIAFDPPSAARRGSVQGQASAFRRRDQHRCRSRRGSVAFSSPRGVRDESAEEQRLCIDIEAGDMGGESEWDDDRGAVGRPWASSEDVCYFLFKVLVGNALMGLDLCVAIEMFHVGCTWGGVFTVLWKMLAASEGVLATRRLGYGNWWPLLAAGGLALPFESRRCFRHSCESDLFQALQQVEWHWHAMVQLATQLAAALSFWGQGNLNLLTLWLSVVMKGLVVGVVSMQRLDDKRLLRALGNCVAQLAVASASPTWPLVVRTKTVPCLRDSAWPRLIFVGFHLAELGERTVPVAVLVAILGFWAFLAPVAMVPGMVVRYMARRGCKVAGDDGIVPTVKSVLGMSLALDSAFGAGTPGHFVAAIATTAETVVCTSIAAHRPTSYPTSLSDVIVSWCTLMLVFTWLVFVLERVMPLGADPPSLLPPPPRLLLARLRAPASPLIQVQPTSSNIPVLNEVEGDSFDGDRSEWQGRKVLGTTAVVPVEDTTRLSRPSESNSSPCVGHSTARP